MHAQDEQPIKTKVAPFQKINIEKIFKPYVVIETWATYSINEENNGTDYANRGDISLRRFRFGAGGTPYPWLKYKFQFYLDRLGEDGYAATKGSCAETIGIWNAYITAKLSKNNQLLNLHAGYYWAAISREYNTCPWAVGSFDKTQSAWYMRSFITGTGNGIESGIGLGGLQNWNNFGISYRIGTYEPQEYASDQYANRLNTARIMLSFGDPEETTYKYMLSGNQWQKRNGVTLGFGVSSQLNGAINDTLFFNSSKAYGTDILINHKGLSITGEYFKLKRDAKNIADYSGTQWLIRVSYNLIIANKYIEPVIAYDNYEGEGSSTLFNHIGDDQTIDMGINWYINKDKLKLALHYIIQDGSASSNVGDYLGTAFQFKL